METIIHGWWGRDHQQSHAILGAESAAWCRCIGGLGVEHRQREDVSRQWRPVTDWPSFLTIKWPDYCRWSALFVECRGTACVRVCFSVSVNAICDSHPWYRTISVAHNIVKWANPQQILWCRLIDRNTTSVGQTIGLLFSNITTSEGTNLLVINRKWPAKNCCDTLSHALKLMHNSFHNCTLTVISEN